MISNSILTDTEQNSFEQLSPTGAARREDF